MHRSLWFTRAAALALLAVMLASCTIIFEPDDVTVRGRFRVNFGIELSPIIQAFEPTRGEGATYRVGEDIAFRIRSSQDGYITLSAMDPDGRVYVFARNLRVRAGRTETFRGPGPNLVFSLTPPRGLHRVRASFTPTPTGRTVRYEAQRGESGWSQSIVTEIRTHPRTVRDVAETYFYVR
jgi:hypothetical protein